MSHRNSALSTAGVRLLALALMTTAALAQTPGVADPEQRRRLIEQKLRLVESLINSPAAQNSAYGRDAETPAHVLDGKRLVDRARAALVANQLDEAGSAVDEALRSAGKASARLSAQPGALSTSAQRATYTGLAEQVATYRSALDDMARQGNGEARSLVARIEASRVEADRLAAGGRLGDANRKLGDAYRLAVEALSRLRAGQTVTMSLAFETPAEEYAYERKRFQSSEMLVAMMIDEGRAEGERRNLVDGFLREGRRLDAQAAERANLGDHRAAVTDMEKAATQMNRALQTMGVPVF